MAVLPIIRMGHPTLRRPALALPVRPGLPFPEEIQWLAGDMIDTMLAAPGIGLAAPQVDISQRIIVFRVPAERASGADGDTALGNQVLINPEFVALTDEKKLGWEGCLSIPGLRGIVPRHARIRYRGYDLDGDLVEREATGTHARVIQHELDHLDGVLYLDRMPDLGKLTFTEEMAHFTADALKG
ncbi:peptide deformylase [Niveispirillum sp. SYP-B3756]|uniref:peptide deformylase n=1 Tax=Niveispirillum sp. SYP-B3756 TaxID=2662178 RepID=UPI00135EC662|nr:peptide deformylase [Niveispirillum sp. SYP-B3756]